jgi:Helix-turn-helix domain
MATERNRRRSGADRRITRNGNPPFDSAGSTDDPPARFAAKKRPRTPAPLPLPLLTLPEAAEILKVSVKQVRRYIADPDPRKRLACIDMGPGRSKRVDPRDLEHFIRVHRCP